MAPQCPLARGSPLGDRETYADLLARVSNLAYCRPGFMAEAAEAAHGSVAWVRTRDQMLDDGWLVEMGTHDELLSRDGAYFRLYSSQFAGAAVDEELV